jgi:hypothetical protein
MATMVFVRLALRVGIVCGCVTAFAQPVPPAPPEAAASAPVPVAGPTGVWRMTVSPYTYHYTSDPAHEYVWAVGIERELADHRVFGASYFSNSFGQPSGYIYGGQRLYNFSDYAKLYAQWTAGLLYGYKGEYANKVPFNHNGFSPGLVLSVGWEFSRNFSAQLDVLGNSALMLQLSYDIR